MRLQEFEFDLAPAFGDSGCFARLDRDRLLARSADQCPVRFVVTGPADHGDGAVHCEIGVLSGLASGHFPTPDSLFRFRRRECENAERLTVVCLVPTGVGAEIGGHAGDATPAARVLAAACDRLIVHPNVVNAADINEMSANTLYVEGSVVTRLLMGTAGVAPARRNRLLVVIQRHEESIIVTNAINAVNAARAAAGIDVRAIEILPSGMAMSTHYTSAGRASGVVSGFERVCSVVDAYRGKVDAVAITTVIDVDRRLHDDYFFDRGDIVNPWGGVEAMLTHGLSSLFDLPTAHSPMYEDVELMNSDPDIMDPRKAAEGVSVAFLHCVLKGLASAPRIVTDHNAFGRHGVLAAEDVSCLVVPAGCLGLPVLAALHQGITVIEVTENHTRMRNVLADLPWAPGQYLRARSYLEAAGMLAAMRAGVAVDTTRRPLMLTPMSGELQVTDPVSFECSDVSTGADVE